MGLEDQQRVLDQVGLQRAASTRLGRLMQRFQGLAETSFVEAALGNAGGADVVAVMEQLGVQLGPLEEVFAGQEDVSQELQELRGIANRFEIRRTFYSKMVGG